MKENTKKVIESAKRHLLATYAEEVENNRLNKLNGNPIEPSKFGSDVSDLLNAILNNEGTSQDDENWRETIRLDSERYIIASHDGSEVIIKTATSYWCHSCPPVIVN